MRVRAVWPTIRMYIQAGLYVLCVEAVVFVLNSVRTGKFELSVPGLFLAILLSFLLLPASGFAIWLFMRLIGFLFPSLKKARERSSKVRE